MTAPPPTLDPRLRSFLAESPFDRPAIFAFVEGLARGLPRGARVLDAGAGDAPYRHLFDCCDYVTSDWAHSPHPGGRSANIVSPLDALPVEDASFDIVLSTQVLEHVADPAAILSEFHRLLVPDGELWLTAPFVWELHEEPHDYFRYTPYGLQALLARAGFDRIEIQPLGGYFSTVGQLLRHCGSITGLDGGGLARRAIVALLARATPMLGRLDGLDRRRALPLGYSCRARRPGNARLPAEAKATCEATAWDGDYVRTPKSRAV